MNSYAVVRFRYARPRTLRQHFRALPADGSASISKVTSPSCRGCGCSRVNWMRRVQRSRSATKVRANSIASTGVSLASHRCEISRDCETAESWRSLPLNAVLLGCSTVGLFSTVANSPTHSSSPDRLSLSALAILRQVGALERPPFGAAS
jgi:hypothetical protein